jgi:hypothetical protein
MFLIYSAEGSDPQPGTPEFQEMMNGYMTFTQGVRESGIFEAGAPLEGIDTATTVRVRNGSADTTDGPFAETKEVLGGFYILDCKDLDEALAHAANIPTAAWGSIEVRPVMQM